MIKAVIFDFFGVVVGKGVWELYAEAGGDPVADVAFLDDILTELNSGRTPIKDYHERMAAQLGIATKEWVELNDTSEMPNQELLGFISGLKRNYKVGLISNASGIESINKRLNAEQLKLFDTILVSADVGVLKPDEKIFLMAAKQLKVNPVECVFTDDYKPYLSGARSVGMKTILYRDAKSFRIDLEELLGT